jgi:xylulose-5-phosphate/fructose-6-phosphate phosphoketolase
LIAISLLQPLVLPDYSEFGIDDPKRGTVQASDAGHLGHFLKRVIELNAKSRNFRIFGPDETKSNRLGAGKWMWSALILLLFTTMLY